MKNHASIALFVVFSFVAVHSSLGCRPRQSAQSGSAVSATQVVDNQRQYDWSKNGDLMQSPDAVYSCEISLCPSSATYELALEKEFWRNVQTDNFSKMRAWLDKSTKYIVHSSDREKRPYQIARLRKLNAFGNTMMYTLYDLHPIVPSLAKLEPKTSVAEFQAQIFQVLGSKSAWGVLYLLTGLSQIMNSLRIQPGDLGAETYLLSVGGFAQAAMLPFRGMTGRKAFENTMIGPSCHDIPINDPRLKSAICKKNGIIGPSWESFRSCKDLDSCSKVGTGTEGFTAAAMAMLLFRDHDIVQKGLTILGDGPAENEIALCDSFLCTYNNPNEPKSKNPDASSIAPFKRLGVMLAIAEGYGKLGKTTKMMRVLRETRAIAEKVGWPRIALLDKVEASLTGGNPGKNIPDILTAWNNPNPEKDFAGEIQFPLPVSTGQGACSGCHYGGVMSRSVAY